MHFAVHDQVSDGGEGVRNEDLAGNVDRLAWVLDGATGVGPDEYFTKSTDARWLVDHIDNILRNTPDDGLDLPSFYRRLAEQVRRELEAENYPADRLPPACSSGIVRLDAVQRTVEFGLVGDVYLWSISTRELVSNPYFAARESAGVHRTRARGGYGELLTRDREQIALRRQGYINGVDDQFILSNNPDVARGVRVTTIAVNPGYQFLICTDGFARLVEGYGLYESWESLSKAITERGLASLLKDLRSHESESEGSADNYKSSDDACAMILTVEETMR